MIKKLKSSLTAKIFLLTTLLLTTCCIATYGFIVWLLPKTYPNQIDLNQLESYAYEASQEMHQATSESYSLQAESLLETYRALFGDDLELHIFDNNGFEVSLYNISEKNGNNLSDYEVKYRTKEYNFTLSNTNTQYSLIFFDGTQAVNQALEALTRVFPYLLSTILVIALFTSLAYSKYITAPIKRISRISQKMTSLNFDVTCYTNRTDELGGVSKNLNQLAKKLSETLNELETANTKLLHDYNLEKQMEKQRTELFSAVSHELKTPITIVKGQLQGMIYGVGRYKDRDYYLVHSLEVVIKLEIMVQELLTVARMEAPDYNCSYELFDLTVLLKQCLTAQEDLFIKNDMELIQNLPEPLTYEGDPSLIKRVFDNLITNALSYSPEKSSIIINLELVNSEIRFSIENTGVYIDEEEIPRLFEAFYRTDQSRNHQTGGSGLGLYIVKKVLDLHNAKHFMENTLEGVKFTVLFI